ncbi:MAG: SRPBCC family protein [Bacteroidetes bacterium]|nr:SRPBCC family protein [Bacteroidota bacterium]
MYHITKSLSLKTDIEKLYKFHLDPRNLRLISPRSLPAKVVHISHTPLQKGSEIKIKLNVFPFVSVNWEVLIENVIENKLIVDLQKKGPFKFWRHEHKFDLLFDGTVVMTDDITFEIGFGLLGKIASPFIKWPIKKILETRHKNMELLFGG